MRCKIILPCQLGLSTITCSRDATLSMPCGLRLGLLLLTPTFSAEPATHTRLGWAFRGCSESYRGFPGGANGKEPAYQCRKLKRYWFDPCAGKIPWRKVWQPAPLFLPGESHGQRSLEGYSPQGRRESDTTEVTWHAHT